MSSVKSLLRELTALSGVGGQTAIAEEMARRLQPYCDEVQIDPLGNVCGIRRSKKPGAKTLMLEAHMDEIGMVVTDVDARGFLRVDRAGGVDLRVLSTAELAVYGDAVYRGVVCSTPPHLSDPHDRSRVAGMADQRIDVGMTGEEAKAHIPVGSPVGFWPHFSELGETAVCAKGLDDRAGCAALLAAAEALRQKSPAHNILYCFTTQEELRRRGAVTAAFGKSADAAVSVDVSFAVTPDDDPRDCGKMGAGPMIGVAPILDAAISKKLMALATAHKIPFQIEVMGDNTGTNADMLSLTGTGIPCGLVSVPLRYMHTPNEVVDCRDVAETASLLAAFAEEGL